MNENKFSGKAAIYDKARPSYPEEAIDYILSFMPQHPTIADIGSGTGKLTELLLRRAFKVFAVEPNDEMRTIADRKFISYGNKYEGLCGTAENTLIEDGAADYVMVAQALHWFNIDKFGEECKRILKPKGKVFVIYNKFDGEMADKYEEFLFANCRGFKGLGGGDSQEKIKQFFVSGYTHKTFHTEIEYSSEMFIERALSSSYTAKSGCADYNDFLKALKMFFNKHKRNTQIIFENITSVYHKE